MPLPRTCRSPIYFCQSRVRSSPGLATKLLRQLAVEDDNSILDDNANFEIVTDTDDVVEAADAYASAAVSPPGVLICN